ncbi:MAG TPA: hypothetical protein VIX73_18015 [Kofleriaceae bacterium]
MHPLRPMGPPGLKKWIKNHGITPSHELDELCAQKDAHTSLLYWFTDVDAAIAEARHTRKPIVSLRLLGRLDEELSCANSRFFRRLLYPEHRINHVLRRDFVLHWQSMRPVPRVTIDFGDGRRVERTLTGNSVHLVLDSHGRAVDALPGLFSPDVFLEQLLQARTFGFANRRDLAGMHDRARARIAVERLVAPARALTASRLAMTKHVVEAPLLRGASMNLANDTVQNLELHRRIHDEFASGTVWDDVDAFVAWIYAELFEMPLDDAALGLDAPDPFPPVAATLPALVEDSSMQRSRLSRRRHQGIATPR